MSSRLHLRLAFLLRSHHITPPLRSPLKPRLLTLTQLSGKPWKLCKLASNQVPKVPKFPKPRAPTVPKVPKPRAPKQPWIGLQYNFETKKDAGGYLSSLGLQTKWAAKVVIGGRGAPVGRKYTCTAHADCAYRIRIRPPRVRTLCIQSHFLCS